MKEATKRNIEATSSPKPGEAYKRRAVVLQPLHQQREDEASLPLSPQGHTTPATWLQRAKDKYSHKAFDDAIALAQKIAVTAPEYKDGLAFQGLVYRVAIKDSKQAAACYEKVLEVTRDNPQCEARKEALMGLADIANKQGNQAEALQYYHEVLNNFPSYKKAHQDYAAIGGEPSLEEKRALALQELCVEKLELIKQVIQEGRAGERALTQLSILLDGIKKAVEPVSKSQQSSQVDALSRR